jgi:hypothetical protein
MNESNKSADHASIHCRRVNRRQHDGVFGKCNALFMTAVTLRHLAEFLPLDRCDTMTLRNVYQDGAT